MHFNFFFVKGMRLILINSTFVQQKRLLFKQQIHYMLDFLQFVTYKAR